MRVLYVCSELFPLLKTGGLADVSAALPPALRFAGCDVRILIPAYPAIESAFEALTGQPQLHLPQLNGLGPQPAQESTQALPYLMLGQLSTDAPAHCYLLRSAALFGREGNPYLDSKGEPWPDNAIRFAFLGWAAACLGQGLDSAWQPDVVHCHDWHTGLAPIYMRELAAGDPPKAATIFTIHNLAYQGLFPRSDFDQLGLAPDRFSMDGLEFHDQVSFMKAGLQFAQQLTTVSPSYAQEILTPEQGMGLDGLLRNRAHALCGILNGVDYNVWSPEHDAVLMHHYDVDSLEKKAHAKAQLQIRLNLQDRQGAMIFGVVSRLSEQKGLHLVHAVIDQIVQGGGQLALLGSGDPDLERAFRLAAEEHPGQVGVFIGYHEDMAHMIIAGSDVILLPSRFEPCGLTQLYGLRYGTLPLVHRVGGLADTVVDATDTTLRDNTASGFVFGDFSVMGLQNALTNAFAMKPRAQIWRSVQQHAMRLRFDWTVAAQSYLALYRKVAMRS